MEQYQKSFAIYVICMCIVIARMENGESANPDEEADKQVKYLVTARKSRSFLGNQGPYPELKPCLHMSSKYT